MHKPILSLQNRCDFPFLALLPAHQAAKLQEHVLERLAESARKASLTMHRPGVRCSVAFAAGGLRLPHIGSYRGGRGRNGRRAFILLRGGAAVRPTRLPRLALLLCPRGDCLPRRS